MPYIAHIGIQLSSDICSYSHEKGKWYPIKTVDGIEYRWRFCKDQIYDAIAGIFEDKYDALLKAKQMYITLFYSFIFGNLSIKDAGCEFYAECYSDEERDNISKNHQESEACFFWNKKYQGGQLGPGVFEVENSLDEFEEYKFTSIEIGNIIHYKDNLEFDNINKVIFAYCEEAQKYLNTFLLAENATDIGMKMTIYCGLLEHLSDAPNKDSDTLSVID